MIAPDHWAGSVDLALRIQAELAEFAEQAPPGDLSSPDEVGPLLPEDGLLAAFDARVTDEDLRKATRTRFVSTHYADAVESGVKALNELVRVRSGRTEDGDSLMTTVFSVNSPILRIGKGTTKSDESAQRGHMMLCQGVVGAWRNPRAHSIQDDDPRRSLMMLETINELMIVTRAATRTRKRKP